MRDKRVWDQVLTGFRDGDRAVRGTPAYFDERSFLAVRLLVGRQYTVNSIYNDIDRDTRPKPSRFAVYDTAGVLLCSAVRGEQRDRVPLRLVFTAPRDGTFYIEANGASCHPDTILLTSHAANESAAPTHARVADRRARASDLGDITESGNSRQITLYQIDDRSALIFFRFALSRARLVRLRLQRPKTPAALYLEHAQGTVVCGRVCATSTGEWLAATLQAGAYFVRVDFPSVARRASGLLLEVAPPHDDRVHRPVVPNVNRQGCAPQADAATGPDRQADVIDSRYQRISLGKVVPPASGRATGCYRLVGGNDAGLFELDGDTGELYFVGHEVGDPAGITEFSLTVRSSGGEREVDHLVSVSLADLREERPATDGKRKDLLGTVTSPALSGNSHRIRLVSGNDDGLFEMDEDTGELFWVGSTEDIEDTATVFELSVRIDVDLH